MIANAGIGRGSIITGSSVYSQRVERMWRNVRRVVVRTFRNVFYYLEQNITLDPLSEIDLCALHYVYIPRINCAESVRILSSTQRPPYEN